MTTSLPESGDQNLVATWTGVGRLTGDTRRIGSVHMYATGLPVAPFNGAIALGPAPNPAETITAIQEFMSGRGVPWVLWARPGVADDLVRAGRGVGLVDRDGPPAMGLLPIPGLPAIPPELTVEVVDGVPGLEAHRHLMSRAFEIPEGLMAGLLPDTLLESDEFTILLGKVSGQPVSTSLLSMSGDTAGVYNVATPNEHQRRGYGAALTWAAIGEGVRRGADRAILQASPAGLPVYERMGFITLGTYIQLQGLPD
jgi:N-acetylglutamate synthase